MKKLFYSASGLLAYLSLAVPAFAETKVDICASSNTNDIAKVFCNLGGDKAAKTIQNIVVFFIVLAVVIALLYLLYGGIKWITSRGEKAEVEAARNHIIAAIVGLVVVFLAVFIVTIVLSVFGLKLDQLAIPTIVPE